MKAGLTVLAASLLSATAWANAATHIEKVTAITQVYGDGEQLSAVPLTYDKPLAKESVSASDYVVSGREITSILVSANADVTKSKEGNGRYVVLNLKQLPMVEQGMEGPKTGANDPHPEEHTGSAMMGQGGPKLGSSGNPQPLPTFKVEVDQVGPVSTVAGQVYGPTAKLTSTATRELVIEDFQQAVFKDKADGNKTLKYNLFVPKNYDPKKQYPLVVFLHDAGTVSPETKATLVQGRGAIAWASPEWQAEHPSFVLAPQYDTVIVNDQYEYGPELARTKDLIEELTKTYSIDTKRIYNTGQSMGAMASTQMDISYPNFFAGSYIVGAKWDASRTQPLSKQNIVALVSEGDTGAKPSFDTIMGNLEKAGSKVVRATFNPSANLSEANQ